MKKLSCLILLSLFGSYAIADSRVGEWRSYLSYEHTEMLLALRDKIYAMADGHVFSVSEKDKELSTYSKIEGWSENTLQCIAYSHQTDLMINVYQNSNIDLVASDGTVYNLPDVKDKNWAVDKTVYQIYVEGDKAYLACGFGVVVLNLTKKEIEDTYIVGEAASKVPIYGFTSDDERFYALSDDAIFTAPKQGANLLDFHVWHQSVIVCPDTLQARNLYVAANRLYTVHNETVLMQYDQEDWIDFYVGDYGSVSWNACGEYIVLTGGERGIDVYTTTMLPVKHYDISANYALLKGDDLWYASPESGLCHQSERGDVNCYKPSHMPKTPIKEMSFQNGMLMIAPGGYWLNREYVECKIPYFLDGQWGVHDVSSMNIDPWIQDVYDVTSVAMDPTDVNHFYFTTWGEGVFEVKDGKVVAFYDDKTTHGVIQSSWVGQPHYVRIDGARFDDKGNLWVLNAGNGVKVLQSNGKWSALNYSPLKPMENMRRLLITDKYKWLVGVRYQPGVFVFTENGTIDNISDDKYRMFSPGSLVDRDGNVLSPSYFYDIDEGTDGQIWLATDMGPIVFANLNKIFDNSYRCTRIKIAREDGTGLADYLLDGVSILCIEVDPGNRKWLGTANAGAYLLSEDGQHTIHHFTAENSPLSSNEVSDIVIDDSTGEVFIATQDGLFSYRSDAMKAEKEASQQSVYAFPNPIRPEYGGLVTIAGLEEDSHVWITDASANVVFEGDTNGGSISWDTRNKSGQMVSGGVYFVLVSNANSNAHRSVATKILIVR